MVSHLSEHDPACDSFLVNGEDWVNDRIDEKYPRFNDYLDEKQSSKRSSSKILNNLKIAFIAVKFGISREDARLLITTLRLPHPGLQTTFAEFYRLTSVARQSSGNQIQVRVPG